MPDTTLTITRETSYETDRAANGKPLGIGDLYCFADSGSSQDRQIFRLIHKNPKLNKAWAIQIPVDLKDKHYTKEPISISLSELAALQNDLQIVRVRLAQAPIFSMNDDEIRSIYTNKAGNCPILDHRNRCYAILETLTNHHSTGEILEKGLAAAWVKEQAAVTKRSRAKLYDILHRYWAGNFSKNALLPDYWRSGAQGKEREQKRKLGRPNSKIRADGGLNDGYFLSDADKMKLRLGWRYFLSEGRTRPQAYLETMAVFYSDRIEVQDGKQNCILLPTERRPTPVQFYTWGPNGDARFTASRLQIGEIDWQKKNRGISGSAKDGMVAVGMQAVCDTTTNDAYLKSVTSRIKTVGPVNRLLITESRSEVIFGLHCGFEAPSARTFLLAVAHGASSKVDFCARFGITIEEVDWPACVARTYLGDNGEYRNEASREALRQFGASVDNIPSGQPQYNSVAESKHHVIHARLDHTLSGTTHGKPRRRGKPHPAIDACVNYYEYMRELIIEVLYHNCEERVPHLLTAEMRRAQVKPTRICIYRWLIENGYSVDFTPDMRTLHAHLYPSVPATLTESGIYLLREDRGDKDERIPNARYMSECLFQLGLLEQARRKGNRRVTVRCNPSDPRSVWFQTELGLVELQNIHPDPILYRQATLADLIFIKDEDKVIELENRGQEEQKRVDITIGRQAMLTQAQAEKQSELAELPKPMTKAGHYSDIEKHRKEEITILQSQLSDPTLNPETSSAPSIEYKNQTNAAPRRPKKKQDPHNADETNEGNAVNPALQVLRNYMKEQE